LIESHNIKLNVGVAFINNEKILLSRIGKVKMLLYRKNSEDALENQKVFDVFENVTQFNKEHFAEKRFSSIISGDILDGDRLFFFIPNRRLSFRQNYIKTAMYKFNQEEFTDNFYKTLEKTRIKGSKDLFCCGIHLELEEQLNIISPAEEQTEEENIPLDNDFLESDLSEKTKPSLIASQIFKISKENLIKLAVNKARKISYVKKLYIIIGIALVTLATIFIINSTYQGSKLNTKLKAINEKIKIAESKFLLKQNKEAKKILQELTVQLESINNQKKTSSYITAVSDLLKKIDKISERKPVILNNLAQLEGANQRVVSYGDNVYVFSSGKLYKINGENIKEITELSNPSILRIKENKIISYSDGNIQIFDITNKNTTELKRRFDFQPKDLGIYKDNLYFLGSDNIYKISNALIKPISEYYWIKPNQKTSTFVSFDLDSTVYILAEDDKLLTFYKGKLVSSEELEFEVNQKNKIFLLTTENQKTNETNKEFFIADLDKKIIRHINENAELIESFDISSAGDIKDVTFDKKTSTIYIISSTGLWEL